MIKIQFNSLNSQESAYKNTYNAKGFLTPTEQDIIPISSEWNGLNYVIQNITYNAYEFTIYLRDDLYTEFQNIQNSYRITIAETGDDARFISDEFEYIEHDSSPFGKSFWSVKVKLRHLASQNIENIIDNRISDTLSIKSGVTEYVSINIPFSYIQNVDSENNLADNFQDQLKDFTKTSYYRDIRYYLNGEDMVTYFFYLKQVKLLGSYKINYKGVDYYQYTLEDKRLIGNNLYEITMKLYYLNEITA